jgi:two-component sensor histidine kinase
VGTGGHAEGLGLSLVRRLVQEGLHGELHLHSDSSGTRAEIVFPSGPSAAEAAPR